MLASRGTTFLGRRYLVIADQVVLQIGPSLEVEPILARASLIETGVVYRLHDNASIVDIDPYSHFPIDAENHNSTSTLRESIACVTPRDKQKRKDTPIRLVLRAP